MLAAVSALVVFLIGLYLRFFPLFNRTDPNVISAGDVVVSTGGFFSWRIICFCVLLLILMPAKG